QTMSEQSTLAESTRRSHGGCINQRNPSPTPMAWWDGVVLHALAFNTLLSSQETDAYTVTPPDQMIRAKLRGVRFVLFCSFVVPLFFQTRFFVSNRLVLIRLIRSG
ncbi:hypothetical protein, partial [Streptosporangium sp. NPDC048865]|uniref:hypothetical protein n=1 Tax=Streptosporangium sp. NPDC048865 TaxID=3155766 RepID=UPI003423AA99